MFETFQRVFGNFRLYALGKILQNCLAFILIPLYTKYLSLTEFGVLALMTFLSAFVTRFISAPSKQALNRFYYSPDYQERRGILLWSLFAWMLPPLALVSCALYFLRFHLAVWIFHDRSLGSVIAIYAIFVIFESFNEFFAAFLRLLDKAKLYVVVSLVSGLLNYSLVIFLLCYAKMGMQSVILGQTAGVICVSLCSLSLFVRLIVPRFSFAVLKEPLRYGYPFITAEYAGLLVQSSDRYLINFFGSTAMVGLYDFGYKFGKIIDVLLINPITQAMTPIVFQKESEANVQKRLIREGTTYFYLIGISAVLFFSIFAKDLVTLIAKKPSFLAAWVLVPIVSFAYLIKGLAQYFFCYGVILKNKSKIFTSLLVMTAVINISLNIIFIPIWGILSAAVTTLVAYLGLGTAGVILSKKYYQIEFQVARILTVTAIALILYLGSLVAEFYLTGFTALGSKFILMILFLPLLWKIKFFNQTERDNIIKIAVNFRQKILAPKSWVTSLKCYSFLRRSSH